MSGTLTLTRSHQGPGGHPRLALVGPDPSGSPLADPVPNRLPEGRAALEAVLGRLCFPRRDQSVGRHLSRALADQAARALLGQAVRGSSQPRSGRITR